MNLTAIVLHNESDDRFDRYHPDTSRLFHAHTFEVVADNVDHAADLIYELTNVDDANHLATLRPSLGVNAPVPYGRQVTEYRRRRNRSLSVGDVVIFREGDRPAGVRVVDGVGWEALEFEPEFTDGSNDTDVSEGYLGMERRHRARRQRVFEKDA